jgi:hypothetical protein
VDGVSLAALLRPPAAGGRGAAAAGGATTASLAAVPATGLAAATARLLAQKPAAFAQHARCLRDPSRVYIYLRRPMSCTLAQL